MDTLDSINLARELASENNAWSAQQAQKQMNFQERMSSTAHQREVADLKAAGLNPVLSASHNGASTPTGAMGSTDTSTYSLIPEFMSLASEAISASSSSASGLKDVSDTLNKFVSKEELSAVGRSKGKGTLTADNALDTIRDYAEKLEKTLPYKYRWIAGAVEAVADSADRELVQKFIDDPLAYSISLIVPPGQTRDKVYDRLKEEGQNMVEYFKDAVDNPKEHFYENNLIGIGLSNSAKTEAKKVADVIENSVKSANPSKSISSSGRKHGITKGKF